jgi:small-conductance mechanosensitive channel
MLLAVLAGGLTRRGAQTVSRLHDFLEFFSGAFALVGLSAAVVAGLAASWRLVPVRLRVLAQSAHRATVVMSMSFLVAHILLKEMELHASVLDTVVPFAGTHGRVLWVGLGTVASDMMIILYATGRLRGRFIGSPRRWTWRVLHVTAYLCWPIAILHGLKAGRTPKEWVTLSYVACAALVAVVALARLVSSLRRRGTTRRRAVPVPDRPPVRPSGRAQDVPDERFWAELKAEAAQWTRSTP